MARVFIGVGSNIDPAENIMKAFRILARMVIIKNISTVYETEPEGMGDGGLFYNCVIEVDTLLPPNELRTGLRSIENALGRVRSENRYADREIDLDIILYDRLIIDGDGLKVPDPDILKRAFLAVPLAELVPSLVLPGSNIKVSEAAKRFGVSGLKPLFAYTEKLRAEIID